MWFQWGSVRGTTSSFWSGPLSSAMSSMPTMLNSIRSRRIRPVSWSSSYLFRDPLGISTTTWMGCSAGGLGLSPPDPASVPDEAEELITFDQLPAPEELELDQGGDADDLA